MAGLNGKSEGKIGKVAGCVKAHGERREFEGRDKGNDSGGKGKAWRVFSALPGCPFSPCALHQALYLCAMMLREEDPTHNSSLCNAALGRCGG